VVAGDVDAGLVSRCVRGDRDAFDSLYSKYQDYVFHIVYGILGRAEEANDVTQEVFVQVYKMLPTFRQTSRFATWLYRVAVNRALDAARSNKSWRFLPFVESLRNTPSNDISPERSLEKSSDRDSVQAVLQQVPLQHRDILVLKYYQEMPLEEIAEVLGCSVTAAKVRLHRARLQFKDKYVKLYGGNVGD